MARENRSFFSRAWGSVGLETGREDQGSQMPPDLSMWEKQSQGEPVGQQLNLSSATSWLCELKQQCNFSGPPAGFSKSQLRRPGNKRDKSCVHWHHMALESLIPSAWPAERTPPPQC